MGWLVKRHVIPHEILKIAHFELKSDQLSSVSTFMKQIIANKFLPERFMLQMLDHMCSE